jgi:hypothetical protein
MVNTNRKNRSFKKAHSKVFYRKLEHMQKNYDTKAEPAYMQIVDECQKAEQEVNEHHAVITKMIHQAKLEKGTIEYKLASTNASIRRWETKHKRACTELKKLNRCKKIYEHLLQKRASAIPPSAVPANDSLGMCIASEKARPSS